MTSYIITSVNEEHRRNKLQELCTINSIDLFDQTTIIPEKETSLGIETVKKIQSKAMLKPLRGKNKAIIILQSELLTKPAQNALLKLLEEPPNNTFFFLLTSNLDLFLPTILSRCQIIKMHDVETFLESESSKYKDQFNIWQQQTTGDALKTAEKFAKDKDATLQLLNKMMQAGREVLIEKVAQKEDLPRFAEQLKSLQTTYRTLYSTNTNTRLALEHLFLSLLS